eukprot:gene17685-36263_t
MKSAQIEAFFATLQAANPTPQTELEYTSVFELLAAVLLSAQATDVGVNKATRKLFPVANTPQKILDLGLDGLEGYIKTIGLYRSKARHLMEACRMLVDLHGGEVPRNREALEALPGVGRKTANVVLNVAFGQPTMAVDTHIFRVGNRTGLSPGKNPYEVEMGLMKRVPPEYLVDAHHWLILHGRYVCIARKPLCYKCAVAQYCDFKPKTPRLDQRDEPADEEVGRDQLGHLVGREIERAADDERHGHRTGIHHQHMLQAQRCKAPQGQVFVHGMHGRGHGNSFCTGPEGWAAICGRSIFPPAVVEAVGLWVAWVPSVWLARVRSWRLGAWAGERCQGFTQPVAHQRLAGVEGAFHMADV